MFYRLHDFVNLSKILLSHLLSKLKRPSLPGCSLLRQLIPLLLWTLCNSITFFLGSWGQNCTPNVSTPRISKKANRELWPPLSILPENSQQSAGLFGCRCTLSQWIQRTVKDNAVISFLTCSWQLWAQHWLKICFLVFWWFGERSLWIAGIKSDESIRYEQPVLGK